MEQVTIVNYDGSLIKLGKGVYVSSLMTKGVQRRQMMGGDEVELTISSSILIPIKLGAYIVAFGRFYFLNYMPAVTKFHGRAYEYVVTFEGMHTLLSRIIILNNTRNETGFSLVGTVNDFMDILVFNYNRAGDQRFMFEYTNTEMGSHVNDTKLITFDRDNGLTALGKICEAYKMRYDIKTRTQSGMNILTVELRYGEEVRIYTETPVLGRGLTAMKIVPEKSREYANRIFAIGSEKNIPTDYRDFTKYLKPPTADYIESEQLISEVGLYEAFVQEDSIYPRSNGTITSLNSLVTEETFLNTTLGVNLVSRMTGNVIFKVGDIFSGNPNIPNGSTVLEVFGTYCIISANATGTAIGVSTIITRGNPNLCVFRDSGMPFDLNERDENGTVYLIAGLSAKITFNSGNLAGYSFALKRYTHSTKEFEIIPITDERGLTMPEPSTFYLSIGDQYVLTDITLPQAYIDNAEEELETFIDTYVFPEKSTIYMIGEISLDRNYYKQEFNKTAGVTYYLKTAPSVKIKRTINNLFEAGMLIRLTDFGEYINLPDLYVIGTERDMIDEYKFTKITLGTNKYTSMQLEMLRRQDRFDSRLNSNETTKRETQTMLKYNQR